MDWDEASHILISVVTISLAFALAINGFSDVTPGFAGSFIGILITVGAGFVLHELAHRQVAKRYGAHARYRAWTMGLVLAVVMAIGLGFVFAAPGAVYIYGKQLSLDKYGKVALAGPVMNFALALAFLFAAGAFQDFAGLALTGAYVNAFLGAFNMIPIDPFDGAKVLRWNRGVWFASTAVLVVLMFSLTGAI